MPMLPQFTTTKAYRNSRKKKFAYLRDQHPSLKSLPLAEPLQSSNTQLCLDILIGLDHYYEIVGTDRLSFHDGFQLLQPSAGLISTGKVDKASTHLDMEGSCLAFESFSIPDSEFDLERFWAGRSFRAFWRRQQYSS